MKQDSTFMLGQLAGAASEGANKDFAKRLKRLLRRHGKRNFSEAERTMLLQLAAVVEYEPKALLEIGLEAFHGKPKENERKAVSLGIHQPGAKVPPGLFAKAPMPEPELPHSDPRSPFHQYWINSLAGG
jgi:hypothetical protein